jgi:hypothetical protein
MQFLPDQVRQLPGGIPGNFKFSKVYHREDLRRILDEETHAKTLGEAAWAEWRKGLADAGKKLMIDSARWEKWELQLRPGTDLAQMLREYDPSSFPRYFGQAQSRSAGVNGLQPPLAANGKHSFLCEFENFFFPHHTSLLEAHFLCLCILHLQAIDSRTIGHRKDLALTRSLQAHTRFLNPSTSLPMISMPTQPTMRDWISQRHWTNSGGRSTKSGILARSQQSAWPGKQRLSVAAESWSHPSSPEFCSTWNLSTPR